jgi:NTP pyrophosphatase (non-canonical NTP hydrolase)
MSDVLNVGAIQTRLRDFARDRDWEKYHTPKNLVMALAAEAGELLDLFQWLTPDESLAVMDDPERADPVQIELADITIYLLRLADVLGLDLARAVDDVVTRNESRFPIP